MDGISRKYTEQGEKNHDLIFDKKTKIMNEYEDKPECRTGLDNCVFCYLNNLCLNKKIKGKNE